jgi:replication fork clamp-binding protein CrfC
MIKIALECERREAQDRKAIAVYRNDALVAHYWLKDDDDAHRTFDIVHYLLGRM